MNFENPIILVGPAYPLRGGIAHFNEAFCQALHQEGMPAEIVSFYLQYPSVLFPGKTQKAEGNPPEGIKIHNWISSVNPLSWKDAAKRIVALNPSLVVFRFWIPFMGPALGAIAKRLRKKNIPVIGLVDNAVPHEEGRLDRLLSNQFFKHCDGFFTLSKSVADDLNQLAPGKPVATSPHPVYDIFGTKPEKSEALQKLGLNPDKRYVLFFGFIRAYKGLDLLLEAFGQQALADENIHLLVAGEFYENRKKYDDLISTFGLAPRVTIRSDYIPQHEVKYWFSAADIVAQTYRTATQSGVTQIAYHFGRPMLVTDVGGLAEIVPDGVVGYVVKPNPHAIAGALARFFEENKEAAFSAAASREKKRFSWEHFTRKFIDFAKSIHEI